MSECKLYQQNQRIVSIQNAQKTLKCIECGAVFMNYQELCLHSRLHIPFLPESNIPPQHMHIVESQNTYLNLNQFRNNSINVHINNVQGSLTRPNGLCSTAEDEVPDRASCALHCSLCNHTFTNRTQLVNHTFAHNVSNKNFEKSIQRTIEKSIPNLQYPSYSSVDENIKIRNVFPDNIMHKTEQLNAHSFHPETILPLSVNFDAHKIFNQNKDKKVREECFVLPNNVKHNEKFNSRKLDDAKNRKYKCENCDRLFSQESKLKTHMLSHTDLRPFKCFKCHKAYACKSKLNAHVRLHTKSNVHQCKVCNKIFTYPSYLLEHMNTHKLGSHQLKDSKQILRFECSICKKRFRFAKLLNAHLRLHSGKGLSQCNICDKKFNQKYTLKVHLQTHEAIKLHKCEYCDKSFTQKSNLVEHIRIHTKVKPFECNLCEKKFCQSSHLKSHIASHDSVRQHQCQLCGKRFKLANHLKRHLNSHTGSKTYRCNKCNHVFSQSFSLKRHLKRHDESIL